MTEAMLAGAVPVVSDVGDLGDLVTDGENGRLVVSRKPEEFAICIADVLNDDTRLANMSAAANKVAMKCDIRAVALLWDGLLANTP